MKNQDGRGLADREAAEVREYLIDGQIVIFVGIQGQLVEMKIASSERVAQRISSQLRDRWRTSGEIEEKPGSHNSTLISLPPPPAGGVNRRA